MATSCKYLILTIAAFAAVYGFTAQAMAEELLTVSQTRSHISAGSTTIPSCSVPRVYFEGEPNPNVFGVGFYEISEGEEVPLLFLSDSSTYGHKVLVYGFGVPLPPMARFVVIIDDGDRIICSRNEITGELSFGIGSDIVLDSDDNPNFIAIDGVIGLPTVFEYYPCILQEWCEELGIGEFGTGGIYISSSEFDCTANADCNDGLFCNGIEVCVQSASEEPSRCETIANSCDANQVCDEELDLCVMPECEIDADCDDGIFCNGADQCIREKCFSGCPPCFWSDVGEEVCYEALDQCVDCGGWDVTDELDPDLDFDFDCDVDKEDSTLLKLGQKAEKTALKDRQKGEKTEMKDALGSSGDCDNAMDLDDDCDVDKDDSKLLKLRQKEEKAAQKEKQKGEKDAMKAALQ